MQFRAVKQHLEGHQFHSSDEVEMAVCEWLQTQEPILQYNVRFKLMIKAGQMHQRACGLHCKMKTLQ
jgi:hypothetical protein